MREFRTFATRSFRKRGLRGALTVRLTEDGLEIESASGIRLAVPPLRIDRLRAGVDRANKGGPFYETRLWVRDEAGPLLMSARAHELSDYVAVIGGLAERVAPERLETGLGDHARRYTIGLLSVPLVFALVVWRVALWDKPLWQGMAVAVLPAVVLAIVWAATRSWVPRPAGDLAGFRAALEGR